MEESSLPESLYEVIENEALVAKFRVFLHERLALENLLFFESTTLYERIDETKPQLLKKAGNYLVAQFIKEESEDCVNLSYGVRFPLLNLVDFTKDSFSAAKSEIFDLMSSNFFHVFRFELKNGVESSKASSFDSSSGSSVIDTKFSFERLSELIKDETSKKILNISCGCDKANLCALAKKRKGINPSKEDREFCCELGRLKHKMIVLHKKFKERLIKVKTKKVKASPKSGSMIFRRNKKKIEKESFTLKALEDVDDSLAELLNQPTAASQHPIWRECRVMI